MWISWWPQDSAWNKSGINLGYWSPDAENWFRKRLDEIHSDNAAVRLRTQTHWKNFTFIKKGNRIFEAFENASDALITT